jgi:hypothetical protein
MKHEPTAVVIFGHEKSLLETRQWVLQTRGYKVIGVQDLHSLQALPLTRRIDLLLVCHSVPKVEREAAIHCARVRWPEVRHRLLTDEHGRMPTGILGQLLHTMDGPAKLISLVGEAMQDSGPHARAS